jgi:hypothetical protein
MPRKTKHTQRHARVARGTTSHQVKPRSATNLARGAFGLLVGSGIFAVLVVGACQSLVENVTLKYIGSAGRGYAFQLTNNSPIERKVTQLRVLPPTPQNVVFATTRSVYGQLDENGALLIPGGICSYVPAAEYREADGLVIPGNSSVTFRIPPLSDKDWVETSAAITDIRFGTRPSNLILAMTEDLLLACGAGRRDIQQTLRYLVIDSFWTPTKSDSLNEAIDAYCIELGANQNLGICVQSPHETGTSGT